MEVVSRLYLALVLFSLLKETNLWSVADKFQLSRGFVQALLSSSSAFCSCVLHFTEVPASQRSEINRQRCGVRRSQNTTGAPLRCVKLW